MDSVLSPTVCAVAGGISAAAVGYSLHKLRGQLVDRTIPMTGMLSALIFAGQMINFPLIGVPISGHLMGGVLASVILGPWAGLISLTLVLLVQCLMFADGGLLALGVNILHMGVMGAWGGYALVRLIAWRVQNRRVGLIFGTVVACWVSVVAASALFSFEFWFTYRSTPDFDFGSIFTLMVLIHSGIGLGEAAISAGVLVQILAVRPDLIDMLQETSAAKPAPIGGFLAAGLVAALAVAAFMAPFASTQPDGLEAVAIRENFESLGAANRISLLDDYEIPAPVARWQSLPWWETVSVSLAGLIGTIGTFGLALAFGKTVRKTELTEASA